MAESRTRQSQRVRLAGTHSRPPSETLSGLGACSQECTDVPRQHSRKKKKNTRGNAPRKTGIDQQCAVKQPQPYSKRCSPLLELGGNQESDQIKEVEGRTNE